jgi:hypothetical protein
MSVSDI